MSDYLHGAYGRIQAVGSRVADNSRCAFVYIGTAPVNQIEGGAANVNVPIVVHNMAEARRKFGWSDDWASFTLCESVYAHFELNAVGPLVLINVLDPATHKAGTKTTVSLTPSNGRIIITSAEKAVLDSVEVKTTAETPVTKVKGTDYTLAYDIERKQIVIRELTAGALGTDALSVSYDVVTPASVTSAVVIGATDGLGTNTGVYAIRSVYPLTGYCPSFVGAPGFSSVPAVHTALLNVCSKIGGHWDAYLFADIPILDGSTPVTMATAATWKTTNGYTSENETVYFPMAKGTDGRKYHLSVLAAANFQALLLEQEGIPWKTASNTACPVIQDLYLGDSEAGPVYDDEIVNTRLNKHGIASAAFVGGRWAIWGCHSADYDDSAENDINVSETSRMMLFYISNDFQLRRSADVDSPMTRNALSAIVAEEQTRLDALVSIGALTYGRVRFNAESDDRSDILKGDYSFTFDVTTTPLARSMTAIVNWTDEGFVTWFAALADIA